MKTDVYTEQPKVEFKHKVYGEFTFTEFGKASKVYTYTTSKSVSDKGAMNDYVLAPPVIKSSHQDFNRDGLNERWNITLRVKKPFANAALSQATIILGFDYSTNSLIQMNMETLAIVNIADVLVSSTTSAQKIKTVGTLKLKQESPLREIRGGRNLYNDNLF